MFAPVGYTPLGELTNYIDDVVEDYIIDNRPELAKRPALIGPHKVEGGLVRSLCMALVVKFIEEIKFDTKICSPSGVLMTPGWQFFERDERFKKYDVPGIDGSPEEVHRFLWPWSAGFFDFIDLEHVMIKCTIDTKTTVFDETNNNEGLGYWNGVVQHISKFNQWSLCVKDDFDFSSFMLENKLSESLSHSRAGKVGRPALQPKVRNMILKMFAETWQSIPQKELARHITVELGEKVSVRTIQRAMRQNT